MKHRVHVAKKDASDDPRWKRAVRVGLWYAEYSPDAHLARVTTHISDDHVSRVNGPIGTTERYGNGDVGRARCVPNKPHEAYAVGYRAANTYGMHMCRSLP